MYKQKNKQTGITLIALVVTIIVLIILASVSINMLVGENGIINMAQRAAKETEQAEVEEGIQTDILGIQIDSGGDVTKGDFINILNRYFDNVPTKDELPEDLTNLTLVSKEEYGANEINIGEIWNGTFTPTFAETVTSANYGEYVDYSIDLNGDGDTTNDWQIFYSDRDNVFIIADDYVKSNSDYLDLTTAEMYAYSNTDSNYIYSINWYNGGSILSTHTGNDYINNSVSNLFMYNKYYNTSSTNVNAQAVASLLDTNAWSGFVDSKYAEYAVGGPTLEMWVESYNAKGYTPLYTNTNATGYYIGLSEGTTDYYQYITEGTEGITISGYNDTLYFPHKTVENECYGYWLSSPNANDVGALMEVNFNGRVGDRGYGYINIGVRPLVCLNSNIIAAKDTVDIWKFQKNYGNK